MTSLQPETSNDIYDSNLDSWTLVDVVAKAATSLGGNVKHFNLLRLNVIYSKKCFIALTSLVKLIKLFGVNLLTLFVSCTIL